MDLALYNTIFWPILMAISISKPISDYFWLREFSNENGFAFSVKALLLLLVSKKYIYMVLSGLLFWVLTSLWLILLPDTSVIYGVIFILLLTVLFMAVTILNIKSILVIGLIIVTFANFLLIQLFTPLTQVTDLGTLNNLLSNLISTFNYAAIATAAVGLVWQFGQHHKEDVYGTISTMFYAIGYILLNMLISFIQLFLPTIQSISRLA